MIDQLFLFLLIFSAVISFVAPHWFSDIGVFNFARYTVGSAPGLLDIIGYIWNGFLSLIALMVFSIPGLQIISGVYDAIVAWVVIRFIRG